MLREESARTGRMNKVFERAEEGLNPYARQFGFGKRLLDRTLDALNETKDATPREIIMHMQ